MGNDYIDSDNKVVANERFMLPEKPKRSYAFCSDTAYFEKMVDTIKGVDLLYHEATFIEKDKARAKETFHSTAMQAAKIAELTETKKLIIGHFSSRYPNPKILEKEALTVFANTQAVNDGDVFEI
jgi:ribonuclease Z